MIAYECHDDEPNSAGAEFDQCHSGEPCGVFGVLGDEARGWMFVGPCTRRKTHQGQHGVHATLTMWHDENIPCRECRQPRKQHTVSDCDEYMPLRQRN